MTNRALTLLLLTLAVIILHYIPVSQGATLSTTLALGLLLVTAFAIGGMGEFVKLPRLTGYIFAGMLIGPHGVAFFHEQSIESLHFLNLLALAFIAFVAGGELRLTTIRRSLKSIILILFSSTFVVFLGVSSAVYGITYFIPLTSAASTPVRLAISLIVGVISTARSPSSAIAIICETKACGRLTDTMLAVTVSADVIVILLFAVAMSLIKPLLEPTSHFELSIILHVGGELLISAFFGLLLGKGIVFIVEKIHLELPVVIATMGFVVIKFCHELSTIFQNDLGLAVTLEPLIICMGAGFTVQNFSPHGATFIQQMERIALPIYVAFFSLAGAELDLRVLQRAWFMGLCIVIFRLLTLLAGSYLGSRLAKDPPMIRKGVGYGFITQAGVSLGLVFEISRRYPELSGEIGAVLIAAITVNQIIGPIAMKNALVKAGETNQNPKPEKPAKNTPH